MIDLKFALNRAKSIKLKAPIECARRVAAKSGKPWPAVLLDLLRCINKYEAGFLDYEDFGMYRMNERERENVLTIGKNSRLCRRLNKESERYKLEDKPTFNRLFSDFVRRDWLLLDGSEAGNAAALERFMAGKDRIIVKPVDQTWDEKNISTDTKTMPYTRQDDQLVLKDGNSSLTFLNTDNAEDAG